MNQRSLIAIIIIAGIGSIGSVLAYTGTITANQGSFNNVLVTGICTGCGAGESSFSTYNTIALNTTTTGTGDGSGICTLKVGDDGAVLLGGSVNTKLIYINGTTVYDVSSFGACNNYYAQVDQSLTGEYKLTQNGSTFLTTIYKNNSKLQNLGLNTSQCNTGAGISIALSPNGKYVVAACEDSGLATDRVVVFQGS